MEQFLEFERAAQDIANRINELESALHAKTVVPEKFLPAEIDRLKLKKAQILRRLYRDLAPWQKVQVARHPQRPLPRDYLPLFQRWQPLSGDRLLAEDPAIIAGIGQFSGQSVAVLGVDKGRTTQERMRNNFGMPKPEGYRKAQRIMHLADKFQLPLVCLIDTPGAYPGVDAEARGQSEAIAKCLETLLTINVPVLAIVTGEGGSGGALALGVADEVWLLEHSIYSVISPEGCASILWKTADKQTIPQAAAALKLTAPDLRQQGLIDGFLKEPVGGAQRDIPLMTKRIQAKIKDFLQQTTAKAHPQWHYARRAKMLGLTVLPGGVG